MAEFDRLPSRDALLDHDGDTPAPAKRVAPGKRTLASRLQPRLILRAAAPETPRAVGYLAAEAVATASVESGHSLPEKLRHRLESSLGVDLDRVRVHTGVASQQASRALQAKAYTTGQDIHFAAGRYDPESQPGQRLIAHEVAHTVQQGGVRRAGESGLEVSQPGDAYEREADAFAGKFIAGESMPIGSMSTGLVSPSTIHRGPEDADETGGGKGHWDPQPFYTDENDGLVACSDRYQARNNLDMIILTLSPLVKGGITAASTMTSRAQSKKAALKGDGDLTQAEASDLTAFGDACLLTYRAGVSQMKKALEASLSKYKKPPGLKEAHSQIQDALHKAFGEEDEGMLAKVMEANHYIHLAEDNIHHLVELAEASRKELTMIDQWHVTPAENSFDKILERGGRWLQIAMVIQGMAQAAYACASAIQASGDPSQSSVKKGASAIKAGVVSSGAVLGVASFIGIAGAGNIGLIWADLVVPQTEMCLAALERLDEIGSEIAHQSVEDWWAEKAKRGGGAPVIPKPFLAQGWFPGGQATLNYMWAVFQGNPPEQAPAPVEKFFYKAADKINEAEEEAEEHREDEDVEGDEEREGEGEKLDTEWHLFKANEVKNLREWVIHHKEEVWGMLYGSLPHPGGG